VRGLPKFDDPNLIVGAEDFSDAGVYRLRDDLLIVQSLDFFPPLVDDPFLYGQIAAANSMSDIFTMGAAPTTVMNIVGFPDDKLELRILNEILRGGAERVVAAGAVIVGGHTVRDVEIKYGLSVTGVVEPERLITNSKAKAGDVLVLTKALGTGFITTAFKAGKCPADVLEEAAAGMTQLNSIGRDAAQSVQAQSATDITGFGLAGHAGEMAQASGVTLILELNRLPILFGAKQLARQGNKTRASATNRAFAEAFTRIEEPANSLTLEVAFDAQTSGGLLISVAADKAEQLVATARAAGAEATCVVGSVIDKQDVSLILRD
jgi:selenide,water dikinase